MPLPQQPPDASGMVEHPSAHGFDETLRRLAGAVSQAGLTVFARIDHAAGAAEAGLSMPPATVLIYGHAEGGTPIMLAAPAAALDLPLRVLARVDADGRTVIAFHPVAPMLRAAGVPEALAVRLEPAQRLLVAAVQPDADPGAPDPGAPDAGAPDAGAPDPGP